MCLYYQKAENLEQAQQAKLDLVCRKLQLKLGMSLLDISSGSGSLAKYAEKHDGVEVHGVTVSKEQSEYVKEH